MGDFLPAKYGFAHSYCLFLHDCLVRLIHHGEAEEKFLTRLQLASEAEARVFTEQPGKHIFQLLEETKRTRELGEVLFKALLPALLSDFCHFVFEALACSRKAKLTVTYALLRKPLRENLHYLEWMLADPDAFLTAFYNEESPAYALPSDHTRIREIIRRAIENLPDPGDHDAEQVFGLRYVKNHFMGFDGLCNQALHLVTTRQAILTEKQNLNFVFSDDDSREGQWELLYVSLPTVLRYAVDVGEMLMAVAMKEPMPDFDAIALRRSLGFVLWGADAARWAGAYEGNDPLAQLRATCPRCRRPVNDLERWMLSLFEREKVRCRRCWRQTRLSQLPSDWIEHPQPET